MANNSVRYYKGEDHEGRPMTAIQRGPADVEIVGRRFGMKNAVEISKAEYDRLNSPAPKQQAKSPTPPADGSMKDVSKMNGKQLRAYGKELGLDFPADGMKLADMRREILAITTPEAEQPDGETDEPTDEKPEEMTEAAGMADQPDD